MWVRLSCHVWFFRLSSFNCKVPVSATSSCHFRPTFYSGAALLFGRKLAMQSGGDVTHSSCHGKVSSGRGDQSGPGFYGSNIPALCIEDTGPPLEKKLAGGTLVVNERKLRTPSPLFEGNCDDDSEAESFRDGRSEEVDRDTRGRAFVWCRDFLSGSWKTLSEADFHISIVR